MVETTQHAAIIWFEPAEPLAPAEVDEKSAKASNGAQKAAASVSTVAPGTVTPTTQAVSGLLISTWRDSWTYCKATAKYAAYLHWAPWLGGVSAVLTGLTAMELFSGLQDDKISTGARVIVASVMVISTVITSLQTWTATRVKALNEQAKKFHDLHRKIHLAVEERAATPLTEDYATIVEKELEDIRAGMINPSNHAWKGAREEVVKELDRELERLGIMIRASAAS